MTNQIDKLIDGFNYFVLQYPPTSNFLPTPPSNESDKTFGVKSQYNESNLQSWLEKINYKVLDYVKSLKSLRSDINTQIRQNDHNIEIINGHPLFLLFQIENASLLKNVMADKIFMESLSEKISDDIPASDIGISMAIEVESKPILSGHDINEKLAKTAFLKAMIAIISQEQSTTHRNLIIAAQTGSLSQFLVKLIAKEKKKMRLLHSDNQKLEHDNLLLKQSKTMVNQHLLQIRKLLKNINQNIHESLVDMIQIGNITSDSIQHSQQALFQSLASIQIQLKGNIDLIEAVKS